MEAASSGRSSFGLCGVVCSVLSPFDSFDGVGCGTARDVESSVVESKFCAEVTGEESLLCAPS